MIRLVFVAALITVPSLGHAQIQAGEWDIITTGTSFDWPNASPQDIEDFKKPKVERGCLTPEHVKAGLLQLVQQLEPCKVTRASESGGKVDVAFVCDQEGKATVTVTGSFSATKFDLTHTAVTEQTGGQALKWIKVITGERVGECKR